MIPLIEAMGKQTKGIIDDGKTAYEISFSPRAGTKVCDFEKLELNYPDIYASYVSQKQEGSRPMAIKKVSPRV